MRCVFTAIVFIHLALGIDAQINAEFTASETTGCGSLEVQFADLSSSTVGIVSWQWDIGGINSNEQNPGRIFTQAGEYTICLTVTDADGNMDTECKPAYIMVFDPPTANFTAENIQGCVPLEATFTDASAEGSANIVEWIWGLGGDCGVVVSPNSNDVNCTYSLPGSYTASLSIRDENGCISTATAPGLIEVSAPLVVDFSADTTFRCEPPLNVEFINLSQHSSSLGYFWNFGNGSIFSGQSPPVITYDATGSYDVTLTATDEQTGCSAQALREDYIVVGELADFEISAEVVCLGEAVRFSLSSSDRADSLVWDVGYKGFRFSNMDTLQFLYADPGCYTVSLTRYFEDCEQTSTFDCIRVLEPRVRQLIASDTAFCQLPTVVDFSVAGQTSDINQWVWNFGNGTSDTTSSPTYSIEFNDFSVKHISVSAVDSNGCPINIEPITIGAAPLLAGIEGVGFDGCTPLSFTLSPDIISTSPLTELSWTVIGPEGVFTSSDSNFALTLTDTGAYSVQLIVANKEGCMDTLVVDKYILVGMMPEVDFMAQPLISCVQEEIQFNDLSSSFADEWQWDFQNDGTVDETSRNPVYQYNDFDTFDVALTVIHNGCISRLVKDSFIIILPPRAEFEPVFDCDNPYAVLFDNKSEEADRYEWDFGVPGTSTDVSTDSMPTFVYPNIGIYTVTLIAYNDSTGCDHEVTIEVQISDPQAIFELDTVRGCRPLMIQTTNQSISAVSYEWIVPPATLSGGNNTPVLAYEAAGIFPPPVLVATDIYGCKDTAVWPEPVRVNQLNLSILPTGNLGGCVPHLIDLTASATTTFSTPPGTYTWTIEPTGTTETNIGMLTAVFSDIGNYDIRLEATDSWGCDASVVRSLVVTDTLIGFITDTLGCPGIGHLFRSTSTDELPKSFEWDFGDGSPLASGFAVSHVFDTAGVYLVCLTQVDSTSSCESRVCKQVNIRAPLADFIADTTFADCPPLLVNFDNSSQDAISYLWDFGDNSGLTSAEQPSHLYTLPGIYDVTLIASRSATCVDTLMRSQYIRVNGPIGNFDLDYDDSCVPVVASLTADSPEPYLYIWDYGDGSALDTVKNATQATVTHLYDKVGTYFPSLSVIDTQNCKVTLLPPEPIIVVNLSAALAFSDSVGCGILEVTFSDATVSSENPNFYEWVLEGASQAFSNDSTVTVTYNQPGSYDVQYVVGSGGCFDTIFLEDKILITELPMANFSTEPEPLCAPQQVIFMDQSISQTPIISYEWQLSNGTSGSGEQFQVSLNQAGNLNATLIIENSAGCMDTISKELTAFESPEFTLPQSSTICIGNEIELSPVISTDTSSLIYSWSFNTDLSCLNCPNPIASPDSTTVFVLTITNPVGCSTTESIHVEVSPFTAPDISVTPDTAICQNGSVLLLAQGGNSIYDYSWDTSRLGLSCYENCFNPVATPSVKTTYVVTVKNEFNCSSTDSVEVSLILTDTAFAGEDTVICRGKSVRLAVRGVKADQFLWTPSDGLSCASCPEPLASPDDDTRYVVEIRTSDDGCLWYDTVWVHVLSQEDINAGNDTAVCPGQEAALNGSGPGEPTWSPNIFIIDPFAYRTTAIISETTTFVLSSDVGICVLTDTVIVSVDSLSNAIDIDTILCEGDTIVLQAPTPASEYTWLPAQVFNNPNTASQSIVADTSVFYRIALATPGCIDDTTGVSIRVNPTPDLSLASRIYFLAGETFVTLPLTVNRALSDYDFSWTPFQGLDCVDCPRPVADAVNGAAYTVLVTDRASGCASTANTRLELLLACPDDLFLFPNVFSPNGDGINDEFLYFVNPIVPEIKYLRIYDRWGELVFETDSKDEFWDGSFQGGSVDPAVFVYVVSASCPVTGRDLVWKGSVTVVR